MSVFHNVYNVNVRKNKCSSKNLDVPLIHMLTKLKILNIKSESGYAFVSDQGKTFDLSPLSIMLLRLGIDVLYQGEVSFCSHLLCIFIIKGCWILPNAFPK